MTKSFQEWISEGEQIYRSLIEEFERTEQQVAELEHALAAKVNEVNELARVIGKPVIASSLQARAGEGGLIDPAHPGTQGTPASSANIARALTGNVAVKLL